MLPKVFIAGNSYVISKDLVPTLERKIGIDLSPFVRERIRLLEDFFLSKFWRYIPEDINKITTNAFTTSVELEAVIDERGLPLISLDRVYAPKADGYLEITRVTDPKTNKITIGERPGNPSLEVQFIPLQKYTEINLVDVGAFEGNTILELCDLLEKKGLKIAEIFLGYSSVEAKEKISRNKKVTVLNLFQFYEWVELRDFFGIDGRRIAERPDYFIPYWENLSSWASVPLQYKNEVKNLCLDYNKGLLQLLGSEGYPIERIGKPISPLEVK